MAHAAKCLSFIAFSSLFLQIGTSHAGASNGRTPQRKLSTPAPAQRGAQVSHSRLVDVTFRPPRPTQAGQPAKALRRDDSRDAGSAAPVLVFLNAGGSVISGGADNPARNTSWIAASAGGDVRFPAYSGSARSWQAVTACVRDVYRDFAVDFTDQRPTGTGYSMIVVGGSPGLLGLSNQVGGIAPSDNQVLRGAVGFVFSASSGNRVTDVCEAIVHEVGHTLGLDHAYRCEDPMSYLNGCGPKRFADVAAPCGEYAARGCDNGAATQNSFRTLAALVGRRTSDVPAPVPPVIDDDNNDNVVDPYLGNNQDPSDSDDDDDDVDDAANADDQADDPWNNQDQDDASDDDANAEDYSSDDQAGDTSQCPHQQTSSSQRQQPRTQGRSGHRQISTRTVRVTRVTRLWMRDRSGAWQLVSVRTR